jgi:hypothetical protein
VWKLPVITQLLGNPNGRPRGAQANEAQPDGMDERAVSLIFGINPSLTSVRIAEID